MKDARWFTRAELSQAKELMATATVNAGEKGKAGSESPTSGGTQLCIPGPYAIAHHL